MRWNDSCRLTDDDGDYDELERFYFGEHNSAGKLHGKGIMLESYDLDGTGELITSGVNIGYFEDGRESET